MTDEELVKLIRSSPWSDGFPYLSQTADRIEQLKDGLEAVAVLQVWLEDNLPDQVWEAIPTNLWNDVTALSVQKGTEKGN